MCACCLFLFFNRRELAGYGSLTETIGMGRVGVEGEGSVVVGGGRVVGGGKGGGEGGGERLS